MKNINLTKKTVIAALLLTALNFITFGPSLKFNFIGWDDTSYILNNKTVTKFDVKKMFTELDNDLYKPITLLSFAAEYKFFKNKPFVYRLNNLILHSANAILLLCLIYLLTKSGFIAFLCALVFSVHPLHVESVVWIAERKDVLYLFFMLLSFILYLHYKKQQPEKFYKSAAYWLSNLMLVLSLGVKPMAVTLPVMLILTDWFKGQKLTFKNQMDKLPYFITAGLFTAAPLLIFSTQPQMYVYGFGKLNHLIAPPYAIWFYVYKTFLPLNLSHYYTYPSLGPALTGAGLGLALLGLAAWASYKCRNTKRFIGLGAGLFLLSLLPVCGLVSFHRFIVADRYTYFAQTGIVLIVAYLLFPLWKKYKNPAKTAAFFGITIIFLGLLMALESFDRSWVWQKKIMLINDALEKGQADPPLYSDRAWINFVTEQYPLAFKDMTKAIEISSNPVDSYLERAIMYFLLDSYELAENDLREVMKHSNYENASFVSLADVLIRKNRCNYALEILSIPLEQNKKDARLLYAAANAYNCLGQTQKAAGALEEAIGIDKDFLPAYKVLINYYNKTGNLDKAVQYQKAYDILLTKTGRIPADEAEIIIW